MSSYIHSTAVIAPGVKIGEGVNIGPYVVIDSDHVVLENNVTIKPQVYIGGNTTIGEGTVIYPFACIGTKPQDKKYQGEKSQVSIGKRCEIREYVTINSSTGEDSIVKIGDDCMIMSSCHIAHNCMIGNHVVLSGNVMLAGHVVVEDYAFLSAVTTFHQFVRVGECAMVGALSRIPCDVPPYMIGADVPAFKLGGLNLVGLKRRGIPLKNRSELGKAFRIMFRSNLKLEESLKRINEELEPFPEIQHLVKFCQESKRGIMGLHGVTGTPEE